jgi:predicted lipoprotein with Yx(FWY)xxD motif
MTKSPNAWRQLAAVSFVALLAGCGSMKPHQAQPIKSTSTQTTYVFMRSQTSVGPVVSTSSGMTLYTYDKDPVGQSACYRECAQNWPPYLANGTYKPFGKMTIVPRTDGTLQWAYDGHPLYTFVQDKAPGEIKGNGFHNNWHVVAVPAS